MISFCVRGALREGLRRALFSCNWGNAMIRWRKNAHEQILAAIKTVECKKAVLEKEFYDATD